VKSWRPSRCSCTVRLAFLLTTIRTSKKSGRLVRLFSGYTTLMMDGLSGALQRLEEAPAEAKTDERRDEKDERMTATTTPQEEGDGGPFIGSARLRFTAIAPTSWPRTKKSAEKHVRGSKQARRAEELSLLFHANQELIPKQYESTGAACTRCPGPDSAAGTRHHAAVLRVTVACAPR